MRLVCTGVLYVGGTRKAFRKLGMKSHVLRHCVLIAPDDGDGGPCVLQMYKSKEEMGGKPDAILSVRDCHAMKKLDPPTITGKLAQFADFGFVMTTSSAEFCLLAEDQVGYNIWLTALLTLIDPSACRIDPEFTPYASHYKPPKHKSRKGKGGAHASHSDSSDGSDADDLLLSPAAPAPGGDPRAGAGMATPSAAAAAGAGVGAGEVEGVGRSSTPTRPRAGSGRSSRSNASSGTKRGEPLSKKEEIRRRAEGSPVRGVRRPVKVGAAQ